MFFAYMLMVRKKQIGCVYGEILNISLLQRITGRRPANTVRMVPPGVEFFLHVEGVMEESGTSHDPGHPSQRKNEVVTRVSRVHREK